MNTLNNLLQQTSLSQAEVARSLGISETAVSQVLAGRYGGDQAGISQKIEAYLSHYQPECGSSVWIETENTKNMRYIVRAASRRQKMSLIVGPAGTGKTSALKKIIAEMPEAILIEPEPKTSYYTLLGALCEATGTARKRSNAATANALYAYFRKARRIVLIDEGETLTLEALEGLRRLWDKTGTAMVIVGTNELERQVRGLKREQAQLYSRIYGFWKMAPLANEELAELCLQYGLKKTPKDLVLLSKGNLRKAVFLLEEMEDFAQGHQLDIRVVEPREASQFLML